ncbi:MAG: glycerol-3-phosphate dehydrogenase/oxidase [Chloroflexi bacterium]|nr:glycerol-3-phosphate dehydrogenase/oxidase [Chloroflexota bacterium]
MIRNLAGITERAHDVLVMGGGIYGLFTAWDAAMRGLSVALVEKGDFGGATSFNSLRVIHGGLRYLQTGDIRRMRHSIRERTTFLRIAPYLVRPMPFAIPAYGRGARGKLALSVATKIHDLVGFDRNRFTDGEGYLPASYTLSRQEVLGLFPGLDQNGLTGAAVYYDSQMQSSERLVLAVVRSAAEAGARMANYVEATGFIVEGNQVKGIVARDALAGDSLEIRARLVINCAGPWVDSVLERLGGQPRRKIALSKAFNLLVDRKLTESYAFGFNSGLGPRGRRMFFATPWHGKTLIGTEHLPFDGGPDSSVATEQEIESFVKDINEAYPPAELRREDVLMVYSGLLPMDGVRNGIVQLAKHYALHDHAREDGVDGLISIVGVKFTESRHVAEKAVDLAFRKLGMKPPACKTASTPIQCREAPQHLDGNAEQFQAEVIHSVRNEMALRLSDVIFRRTALATFGLPDEATIRRCASIMATELGWDARRTEAEIESLGVESSSRVRA